MEKIVKEVLMGKKGAATRFYAEYERGIRKFLRVKLNRKEDIEEILQDVFLSAFDGLPLFRGESSVKSWLLSIARHEVADFYRKRYIRKLVEQTGELYEDLVGEMNTPEFELKKNQIKQRFNKAMGEINGKYQRVLFLRYEMGMSVKQVAREMEMSFKATESLIYRARAAFAEAYEENGA